MSYNFGLKSFLWFQIELTLQSKIAPPKLWSAFTHVANIYANRPFPSSKKSHFENEAKCETFLVKISFICIIIKNHFHINGFALSLALKVRFFGTRKWPNRNKKHRSLIKRVQLPQDWFGTPTWPPFHPIWLLWRHVKTRYRTCLITLRFSHKRLTANSFDNMNQ